MDEQRVIPGGRRGTPLYDRAGTILVAGILIVLAGLLQLLAGGLLLWLSGDVPEELAEIGDILRFVGIFYLVLGVLALVTGSGVLAVRRWARYLALAYGFLSLLVVGLMTLATRDPRYLFQPNVAAVVTVLLLAPKVGAAFLQAKEERVLRRAAKKDARSAVAPLARAAR